jgi:GNAT superfamily N-acetyltransferase
MLLTLPDGTRVIVRAIVPEDKPLLVAGLSGLSPRSAFQRFLSPKAGFTEAELRYLTEVDQRDHIALVAILADGPPVPVAVARCVRVAPDTAEMAIVVGDRWQGLGLGKRLTAELARRASAEGVRKISGTMLADNRRAFRLMRASFRTPFVADNISSGVREVVARVAVA